MATNSAVIAEGFEMKLSLNDPSRKFIDEVVAAGRFASETEALEEAVKLLRARERKITELRASLKSSIAGGGSGTVEQLEGRLSELVGQAKTKGL